MNKVKIITDACSDISKEWREKYDIDYVPLTLIWNDKEVLATCDWDNFTAKEYYDALRAGARIKSNQTSALEFEHIYNKYLDEGYDIVYIGCSSWISGTYSVGTTVAKNIMEKRAGAKILTVDAKVSCGGQALIVVEAAKLAASGESAEKIAEHAIELSKHVFQTGSVDTLEFLKRAGRVKAAAAFFGNLFGVKPIIVNDVHGANFAVKKVKGRQASIDYCIELFKETLIFDEQKYPVSEQTVYIAHADCRDTADQIAERIMSEIKPKDVYINFVGPSVGASVGPGMFAIYGFGKPVTLNA